MPGSDLSPSFVCLLKFVAVAVALARRCDKSVQGIQVSFSTCQCC